MDTAGWITVAKKLVRAFARFALVAVLLPFLPVLFLSVPVHAVLAVMSAGFLIEYGAAPVGIALGISPWVIFYILLCTETGIFLGLYDVFRTLGETSEPVARFLEKSRTWTRSSKSVERYGFIALAPCEILLGVYICAPISWVLGWQEYRSLLVTLAGYIPALAITIWLSLNLSGVILP
jgi:uncharacterized membrane protein